VRVTFAALTALAACWETAVAQQVPDTLFNPPIANPAYPTGQGPVVGVDAAHVNFHTADNRYLAFARLLRRDGYRVESSAESFSAASLAKLQVLAIANALGDSANRVIPTRSAFTDDEIAAVERWVAEGGALLLIADHMPIAGAAAKLARAFGVHFINGYAVSDARDRPSFMFRRGDGSLVAHTVTDGRTAAERVDSVLTFTGQAFRATVAVEPVLIVPGPATLFMAQRWGEVTDSTPTLAADGLLQGALLKHGRGRAAFFGEAAAFSAQRAGAERWPMGMNAPEAAQNPQFVLNVMHWLTGFLGGAGAAN
jgi:hypothetical protein